MPSTTFTARPVPTGRGRLLAAATVALLMAAQALAAPFGASAATTGSITGRVFEDVDRDGVYELGEPVWADKGVSVYTPDGASWVAAAVTDAFGRYEVSGLAPGEYLARYDWSSWREVRYEWAPTTTVGVWPERVVSVDGSATFDLGWRPITTSADWDAPLSTFDAASGLRIESYTDAVPAGEIFATLTAGSLLGDERAYTRVRFGYPGANSSCKHSVSGAAGSYSNFSAKCHVDFEDWLRSRHSDLFHEYGHAWSRYHQKIVNQWGDFDAYLVARGIDTADDRLGSSHKWQPSEMIAEDFRLLFGSPNGRSYPQENDEVPHATEVDGLETWLSTTFMGGGTVETDPDEISDDTTAPNLSNLGLRRLLWVLIGADRSLRVG